MINFILHHVEKRTKKKNITLFPGLKASYVLDTQYKRRWIFCLVLRLRLLGLVAFCEINTGWGEEDDGVGKGPVEDQLGSGGDHGPCWRRCWLRIGSGRSQASLIYPHVTSLRTKPNISCGSACDVTVFNWIRTSCIALAVGLPACLEAHASLDRRDLQEISRGMTSLFYSSEIPNSLASLGLTGWVLPETKTICNNTTKI